jgi:nitrogen fixation/metabolism regulation signal transduction histidine kinase
LIPASNNILNNELEVQEESNKDYKLYIEEDLVNGTTDGIEVMKQVIYKILNTERYEYIIYSWNYGIELKDLYGEHISYVCSELERRITEALIQDARIKSVDSFLFENEEKRKLHVTFTVHTIFGDVEGEKVVNF